MPTCSKEYMREYMRKRNGYKTQYNKDDTDPKPTGRRWLYLPSQIVECHCGSMIQEGNLERHQKSKQHQINLEKNNKLLDSIFPLNSTTRV